MATMDETIPLRPAPAQEISRRNEWIVKGLVLALLAYGLYRYVAGIDWEFASRYFPRMLEGLWITIQLVVIAILLGFVIALPVAFARMSPSRIVGALAYAYVYFFRGTPLLAQIFLVYYGAGEFRAQLESVGLWWLFREAWWCALLVFTLNTAAYQAEIYKGAVQSVSKGQWEGARALGLHRLVIMRKVVLPQAAVVALRPLGNEIIFMIKGSAIASVITVFDLMGETRLAYSRSYDFQVYLWAAALYLALVEALRRTWDALEHRLTRHLRRDDGHDDEPVGAGR